MVNLNKKTMFKILASICTHKNYILHRQKPGTPVTLKITLEDMNMFAVAMNLVIIRCARELFSAFLGNYNKRVIKYFLRVLYSLSPFTIRILSLYTFKIELRSVR